MRSILGEDDSSCPIRCTNGFSRVERGVPNELPLIVVVSEIQAHVVTQIVHILNSFVLNSGSPCCTQSNIIFSELNFHHEKLVELFVQGVLGDLVHQNRILFESDDNDSLYCSCDFLVIDFPTLIASVSRVKLSLLSF